ncbi:MAG: translation elongation factor Ts [Spirochaetes bacterium GWF1_41_5]|nr:MAG: translation elongation factor Ts [Spirochaetes bacterium GWF1_41_5]HBE04545.1 translation elongation factor Ts [Spirochaetia bacterium]
MAEINAQTVMELRRLTGISMMECKKALSENSGDIQKAVKHLKEKGLAFAEKKASRQATQGIIASYVHSNLKIGVLVELNCETDFVARNEEFREMGKEIAMQICAMNPVAVTEDQVPAAYIDEQKEIFLAQMKDSGKPKEVNEKIVEGKLRKFISEQCLLEQQYVKDASRKIKDLITEKIQKLGENIKIGRFIRYEI